MKKLQINKVKSNMDKHYTYQMLNKAKNEDFNNKQYISVLSYSYAMIEDRLLSMLHYLYVTNREFYPYKLEKKIEKSMTKLLYPNKEKETSDPKIEMISTKIKIIRKICNYKKDDENIKEMKQHLELVLDIKELKKDINNLEKWVDFRNEVVHSLYNKDMQDFESKIKEKAEIGIYLSNRFDLYSDLLKGNTNNTKSVRKIIEEEQEKCEK